MNELEKQLAEIIKKALAVAEKSGEIVIDQAPQLLQEFYHWHIVSNIFTIVLTIIIATITYRYGIKYFKYFDEDDYLDTPIPTFLHIGTIISLFFLLNSLYNLIFILVAPKLYLIEYFVK